MVCIGCLYFKLNKYFPAQHLHFEILLQTVTGNSFFDIQIHHLMAKEFAIFSTSLYSVYRTSIALSLSRPPSHSSAKIGNWGFSLGHSLPTDRYFSSSWAVQSFGETPSPGLDWAPPFKHPLGHAMISTKSKSQRFRLSFWTTFWMLRKPLTMQKRSFVSPSCSRMISWKESQIQLSDPG